MENIQEIEWVQGYTIFVQPWGIMVAAAFIKSWRTPIMLYSMTEKAFMVFLVTSNAAFSYSNGFSIPAGIDAIITVYSILYFMALRKNK